jgi:hypothetical protein
MVFLVKKRNLYNVLVVKFEGKRPLGRPAGKREKSIKQLLKKKYMKAWSGLTWLRIGTGSVYL